MPYLLIFLILSHRCHRLFLRSCRVRFCFSDKRRRMQRREENVISLSFKAIFSIVPTYEETSKIKLKKSFFHSSLH